MSSTPIKIDGIGTRKNGSGGDTANFAAYKRSVRLFATEAIAIGDAVAFNMGTTTNGVCNHIQIADAAEVGKECVVGVAITAAAAAGDLIEVQVAGLCEVAKLLDTGDAVGEIVGLSTTAGSLTEIIERDSTGNMQVVVGYIAVEGTANTADSSCWLLNPASR